PPEGRSCGCPLLQQSVLIGLRLICVNPRKDLRPSAGKALCSFGLFQILEAFTATNATNPPRRVLCVRSGKTPGSRNCPPKTEASPHSIKPSTRRKTYNVIRKTCLPVGRRKTKNHASHHSFTRHCRYFLYSFAD